MKKTIALFLAALLLTGCAAAPVPTDLSFRGAMDRSSEEKAYISRFDSETDIFLSDTGITVNGGEETASVFTSRDIIYYEDRDFYESGYPYGEGGETDRHSQQEAESHLVVNITVPGAYRVSGSLSAGQIRIDLGENAYADENAVVELILENAYITCTVAPAILFLNTYECDADWSADTACAEVDTSSAGANLILEGENTVSGSYVAKIYKDKEGEKKLWKQDGAIYSYRSLNVYGPGSLDLTAENEGLDTELHLTINGGRIAIRSGNDGINTNEDGVSVTTVNGGSLHIIAGLGDEGDGIDSNGWLVINGGTVVSAANPAADAGLDSDLGSYIHGGTVIALGSTMDWAESDSSQVAMNLHFAEYQDSGSAVVITRQDGTLLFAYDPSEDEVLGENQRRYIGAILSCPDLAVGDSCFVFLDGTLTGEETGGIYSSVTGYEGGVQMRYSGTDLRGGFEGGQRPGGMAPPEGFEGWDGGFQGFGGERPEEFDGEIPTAPEGMEPPEGLTGERPEDWNPGEAPSLPEGEIPSPPGGEIPWGRGDREQQDSSEEFTASFLLRDKVNAFSGVSAVQ